MSDLKGIGNINGVTCYINTTLQCLGNLQRFKAFVLLNKRPGIVIESLKDVYDCLYVKKRDVVPNRFIKDLQGALKYIEILNENDLNEFIVSLLDHIHNEICITNTYTVPLREISNKFEYLKYNLDVAWHKQNKHISKIIDIFYGQHVIQTQCSVCKHICHNYEPFSNMMLPVPDDANTLQECLKKHFTIEEINDWKCDKCENKANNQKSIKLWRVPEVLVIALNRFHSVTNGGAHKVCKTITAPLYLDLSKYNLNSKGEYRLKSIANHYGNLHGGHYNSFLNINQSWYFADDMHTAKLDTIRFDNAYMFFYESL